MTKWWCAAGTWSHSDPPPGFDVYVLKTATVNPRVNPCPLVLRKLPDGGYLNRIGVRNPGIDEVLATLPEVPGKRVVSVLGFSRPEWPYLAKKVEVSNQPTLELNLSCPNTEEKPVGTDVEETALVVATVRDKFTGRLGVKLPPTTNAAVAMICETAGADYLCLTNTLGTPLGGLSGRPLRALALDCISQIAPYVSIPIVGGGGIVPWLGQDYLDAGATDLFIGTGNIINGAIPEAAKESK